MPKHLRFILSLAAVKLQVQQSSAFANKRYQNSSAADRLPRALPPAYWLGERILGRASVTRFGRLSVLTTPCSRHCGLWEPHISRTLHYCKFEGRKPKVCNLARRHQDTSMTAMRGVVCTLIMACTCH